MVFNFVTIISSSECFSSRIDYSCVLSCMIQQLNQLLTKLLLISVKFHDQQRMAVCIILHDQDLKNLNSRFFWDRE